ncbi:MAG: carboxypeptidase regulatory-like domain-containing protein, partial [Chloroflexi bacterium]|nr:carboxypeptidase regulatory-like domain-containing protein [Chloroflexota bacterium]
MTKRSALPIARKKIILAGLLILAAVLAGVGAAWVQDIQHGKALAGEVTDEQSQEPVAGASVQVVRGAQERRETRSDENGHYRLTVGDGPWTVTAQAPGYEPTSGPFQPEDTSLKEYLLHIVLRPYILTGVIRDAATRKPILDATLTAGDLQAQTEDDGRFTLARLSPGAVVRIEAAGYYPHEVVWNGESAIDFTLNAHTITVAAHDAATDSPLSAAIFVSGVKYQTDRQGNVVVPEPEPNSRITARLEDYTTAEAIYTGQAQIELSLKPSSFKMAVKNAQTGKPVAGAALYIAGALTATSSDEGKIGLSDIKPGTPLKVKAAGYTTVETPAPASPAMDILLTPFAARGIYLPFGLLANESKVRGLIDLVDQSELNALVVDVKGDRGRIAFHSDNPLIKAVNAELVTMDLRELIRLAHEKKVYVIGRIVVFKDDPLAKARPDLAVKTKSGAVWKDNEQLSWANPYSREVWNYNLAIAKEAAALGIDEIQFDYIRFPSDGDVNAISFPPPHTAQTRAAALKGFLTEANKLLKAAGVFMSADIFGMTVWTRDDMGIGQRLEEIAPLVDYVQPMLYPSTFASDNLGYKNPSQHPYDVIFRSVKAAAERITTPIRPWLQAYSSRDVTYGAAELVEQKRAADAAGSAGWTFWNAGGQYLSGVFGGP